MGSLRGLYTELVFYQHWVCHPCSYKLLPKAAGQLKIYIFFMGVVLYPSYDPVLTQDDVQRPLDTSMDLISQIVTNTLEVPGHVVDSCVL